MIMYPKMVVEFILDQVAAVIHPSQISSDKLSEWKRIWFSQLNWCNQTDLNENASNAEMRLSKLIGIKLNQIG